MSLARPFKAGLKTNRNGVASATREIRIFQASLTRRVSDDAILPGLESRAKFNRRYAANNAE